MVGCGVLARDVIDRAGRAVHVIEHHWKFDFSYQLEAVAGAGGEPLRLIGRAGTTTLITSTDTSPRPEHRINDAVDVNITWIMQHAGGMSVEAAQKKKRKVRKVKVGAPSVPKIDIHATTSASDDAASASASVAKVKYVTHTHSARARARMPSQLHFCRSPRKSPRVEREIAKKVLSVS
jgi:hypothetical protein